MPIVSIIVPNYNHAGYLKQRLDSIFNQTYQDFEVILLDDASTDGSDKILQTYSSSPKVSHLLVNKENTGSPFKQWQKGIELAKGKYIWIAESDDWAEKYFLEKLIPSFDHDDIGLVYCKSYQAGFRGRRIGPFDWGHEIESEIWKDRHVFDGKDFIKRFLRYRNVIANVSAVCFNKSALELPNSILHMKYCGDWQLYLRIASKENIAYIPEYLNYFRRHENSTTIKPSTLKNEKIRFREYFDCIKDSYKLLGEHVHVNKEKHQWLIDAYLSRKIFFQNKLRYLFPEIPSSFMIVFYKTLLSRYINFK